MCTCTCKCACKEQKKPFIVLLCHTPPIHSRNGFFETEAKMFFPMLGVSDFSVSPSPALLCGC